LGAFDLRWQLCEVATTSPDRCRRQNLASGYGKQQPESVPSGKRPPS